MYDNQLIDSLKSSRCDRAPVVCKYGEMECLRKPMKIFYSYTSVSHMMQVPMRIFTTRVNTYSRRIKVKGDFKVVETPLLAVGNCAIGEYGSKAFVTAFEDASASLDVEVGFLLSGETGVW